VTTVPVGTLSDAELALLAPSRTATGRRPVLPLWSRLGPDQREDAVRRARGGLLARGVLEAGGPPALRRDLRSLLLLRGAATAVVAVARATPRAADHWYAHVVRDVALLEQVSDDGVHRFALTAAVALPETVAAAVLHPLAARAVAPTPADETDWLRADVEARGAGPVRRQAWVSAPGGTWLGSASRRGWVEEPSAPDAVRRAVADLVTEVVEDAGDG